MSSDSVGTPQTSSGGAPRPAGVAALSIFFAFGAGMALLAASALLFPGSWIEPVWRLNPRAREGFSMMGSWSVVLMALVSVACAASAIGLWKGARWAHSLAICLLVVNLLVDLLNGLLGADRRVLLGVPVAGAILAYLAGARVRRFFSGGAR